MYVCVCMLCVCDLLTIPFMAFSSAKLLFKARMYVCVCGCVHICTYDVCMHMRIYVCVCVCTYFCMCEGMFVCFACMFCMYLCIYACTYVCTMTLTFLPNE